MSNLKQICFFCVMTAGIFIFAPDGSSRDASRLNIRGIEKSEPHASDFARAAASGALYLPRKTLDSVLLGLEKSGAALSDPDFIERVENVLYLYERKLLWFPIVSYASGFRPEYGLGLHYRGPSFRHLLTATIHDRDHYEADVRAGHSHYFDQFVLKTSVRGVLEKNDDLRFYGIGGDPRGDDRNRFLNRSSDQDYGVFTQTRKKIEWGLNLAPSPNYGVRYLGYYQRKSFRSSGRGDHDLRDVFDLSQIPGLTDGSPVTQIYNEISLELDTRVNKEQLSPGVVAGVYAGLSNGLRADSADMIRMGGDAAWMIPIQDSKRLLMFRSLVDYVDAYRGTIPFTEYSRDLAFRGISSYEFIRNDRASVQPSIEYQWRLSEVLGAHLFIDYLAVGKNFHDLEWRHGAWASGFGLDVRWRDEEWGRVELAGGTAGFQLTLSINKPIKRNMRSQW